MMSCRKLTIVVGCCLALCAASVAAAEGSEATRYQELTRSDAAFASAVGAHRRGDLDAAERGYRDAIAKDGDFVEALVNLARVYIERRELSEAAAWLDRAEARHPEYPGIAAVRGLLALQAGDAAGAIGELSQARSVTPRDVEVLTNLAAALLMQETNREAIEILEEVRQLDPHRADASFNLGLAYDQEGDTPRAIHHYKRYVGMARRDDPQRGRVMERIEVLAAAGAPEPGRPRIELHSSSPATSTRAIAKGGTKQ